MARQRKLVEVTWEDAHSYGNSSWSNYDEDCKLEISKPVVCRSVGYILNRANGSIALAGSLGYDTDGDIAQIGGHITIPAGMVRKVRVLK